MELVDDDEDEDEEDEEGNTVIWDPAALKSNAI